MARSRTALTSKDAAAVEVPAQPAEEVAGGALRADSGVNPAPSGPRGDVAGLDPASLMGCIEAALFTAQRPMALGRLCQTLIEAGMPEEAASPANVKAGIASLNEAYGSGGRAFRIESVAGGFRVMTLGAYAPVAASVRGLTESTRLSRAAIETLAIIAYRQPITRVDIESIRGSATGEVLRTLLEKRLVTIVGRAEELGRPMLYGTTKRFLEVFGLSSLRDLPAAGPGGLGSGGLGPEGSGVDPGSAVLSTPTEPVADAGAESVAEAKMTVANEGAGDAGGGA